ncbi:MAG: hypothetical protein CO029_00020 [Candidatus Magasanikbacteria bacterium CG_4_9_14_0_2_um_filter_41_10]|uniref:Antitoxin n=1 Tax=Candidatus Magasanikbacteria bacterium CG_4_10_14_0_2_um_filter_41_31 TaxID=1974639 RepID=A0A2M7V615_9BACT|nr:MAG: hypothetical protein AUJ37_04780 [Candidatus Magasanikbacteria bacterium CG1_02_41_34]PIZ94053.1 MAG: hypothetical protein COX83_00270 [Candidatus Magasanikbacteria bacterium CG_4_10_14_0_2_um_filter_41_31]PJC53964.1 MAG: hypothetical protein CO029_00020 [Candidatus Magasanikbacteria bacterium CG_4_9_14_0_2_um_filter_41_10]
MNNLVSLKELRTKLTNYTKRVSERGDSFIVLKKSKPVFKIVPIEEDSWETVADFTKIDTTGVSFEDVKKAAALLA